MGAETDRRDEIIRRVMERLDEILCSYQGRGHQTVYIDLDSLALFSGLILYGQVKAENYEYEYNPAIDRDEIAVSIYRKLAPQTRWRVGRHTQIEQIRMNALRQFSKMGVPEYHGQIYYPDTRTFLICGEILPYEIFQLFVDMPEAEKLYIVPYPFRSDGEKPKYYSFAPDEGAKERMKQYVEHKFEEMCRIVHEKSKDTYTIPPIT